MSQLGSFVADWSRGEIMGKGFYVGGKRILIQASDSYSEGRTNVKHWWIDLENAN